MPFQEGQQPNQNKEELDRQLQELDRIAEARRSRGKGKNETEPREETATKTGEGLDRQLADIEAKLQRKMNGGEAKTDNIHDEPEAAMDSDALRQNLQNLDRQMKDKYGLRKAGELGADLTRREKAELVKEKASDAMRETSKRIGEVTSKTKAAAGQAWKSSSAFLDQRMEGIAKFFKMPFSKEGRAEMMQKSETMRFGRAVRDRMKRGEPAGQERRPSMRINLMSKPEQAPVGKAEFKYTKAPHPKLDFADDDKDLSEFDKDRSESREKPSLRERWRQGRERRREAHQNFRDRVADARDSYSVRLDNFYRGVVDRRLEKKEFEHDKKIDTSEAKVKKHETARDLEIGKKVSPKEIALLQKRAEIRAKYDTKRQPHELKQKDLERRIAVLEARGGKGVEKLKKELRKTVGKIAELNMAEHDLVEKKISPKERGLDAKRGEIERKYEKKMHPHRRKLEDLQAAREELGLKRTTNMERKGMWEIRRREGKISETESEMRQEIESRVEARLAFVELARQAINIRFDRQIRLIRENIDELSDKLSATKNKKERVKIEDQITTLNEKIKKLEKQRAEEIKKKITPKIERFNSTRRSIEGKYGKKLDPERLKVARLQEIRRRLGLEQDAAAGEQEITDETNSEEPVMEEEEISSEGGGSSGEDIEEDTEKENTA